VPTNITVTSAVEALASALLIGLLIGAQREEASAAYAQGKGPVPPGLRDFLLMSLAGGVCGLLGSPVLAAGALVGIAALLAVYHYEARQDRAGITTEIAGVATFTLAFLSASSQFSFGRPLGIAVTLVVVVALEAKQRLQKFARETITESEFNATLAFIALVMVIYPLLPAGAYGPFSFFSPRQVWMFVILISSISYVGYFFEKFLGEEKGLLYTSVLGGLASTTAATLHFARLSKDRPQDTAGLWRAFAIANTVQFPRTLLIVALISRELAWLLLWPLLVMTLCGMLLFEMSRRWPHRIVEGVRMASGNPFRIQPALRFGVLFTAIVFVTKAATARVGTGALYGTSLLGGLIDVATVVAPAADLLGASRVSGNQAAIAVLLALGSNAVLKIAVAALAGTSSFALRVSATFALWAAAGVAAFWIALKV
jgi:uncharacterized membrane protein (DUF4010 family)